MKFNFNEIKATQAIAYFLKLSEGQQNCIKILKAAYFSDRKSLLERGHPFIGASFENGIFGSVSVEICDQITGRNRGKYWADHLKKEDSNIKLIQNPGDDELSEYQTDILEEISKRFKEDVLGMLFDEKESNEIGSLTPEKILETNGVTIEEINRFQELNRQALLISKHLITNDG